MLEEKDRRALEDIEQRLCASDPAFARRMGSPSVPFPTVSVLCVLSFMSLPFVGLFLGPRAVLVAINATAVVVMMVLVWRARASR
ncbi:DUF3040 domain-containing protein [Actinoplanes siamensis]|nr:DUF3040 domain-containing protein [Actinoplanes siamensis]